jgi:glycosyltransferase involved in cell wall biosynthesis
VGSISAISIVVPAYNAAGTIVETITSALDAARELDEIGVGVEIVVVDDGSTDGTVDVMRSEFGDDARLRVARHRRNRGGAAARNTAVEHATHEWVFCLDSDNLLDPKSVRRLVEMAATGEWDVVAPGEMRFFDTVPAQPTHVWFWDSERMHVDDALRMYETPVACGNYLYTVDMWARAGGYPEFAGSLDAWGFGMRALFEGGRFGVCRDAFYLHRQGHESYYIRDNDDRRSIAAAQILLPYLDRLIASDRARLIDDGDLLRFFVELPQRPLRTDGTDTRCAPARIESAKHGIPRAAPTPSRARLRQAARRAWEEWPPKTTLQRVLRRPR